MLLLPALMRVGEVTVYADDESWYTFYAVSDVPRLRHDEQGDPMFLLTEYGLPDELVAHDGALPSGGGTLNFDVTFTLTDDEHDAVMQALTAYVAEEHERLRRVRPRLDDPAVRLREPPTPILAEPTWTSGLVRMSAPASDLLTEGMVEERPASLLSGNTAVFRMDLTRAGAGFFAQTLVGAEADDAIDLTPIQVVYELRFWARIPPVTIRVSSDSERVYRSLSSVVETEKSSGGSGTCTRAQMQQDYTSKGINVSRLKEEGTVEIHIDQGDATLSPEQVTELQNIALSMVQSMIEDRFFVPVEPGAQAELPDPDSDSGDAAPSWSATLYSQPGFQGEALTVNTDQEALRGAGGQPFAVRSLKVQPGHKVSLYSSDAWRGRTWAYAADASSVVGLPSCRSIRVYRPATTRYALASQFDRQTMSIDVTLDRSQVIEWSMAPQATLQTFLGDRPPSELSQFYRRIDLVDRQLHVAVRAFATFEDDGVAWVEVQVQHLGDEPDQLSTETFTFTDSGAAQEWHPQRLGDSRRLRYRWRLGYAGQGEGAWTDWVDTEQPEINVSAADPGRLQVEVLGDGVNFELVTSVLVSMSYADPDAGVEPLQEDVVLDSANRSAEVRRLVYAPITQPLTVQCTYTLADGQQITGDSEQTRSDRILVPPPPIDTLDVLFMPTGQGWSKVSSVGVFVRRRGAGGIQQDQHFVLRSDDEFVSWEALLSDPDDRTFEYQVVINYSDSPQPETRPWQTVDGDGLVQLHIDGPRQEAVSVFSKLVDFDDTTLVTVTLRFGEHADTLSFTEAGHKRWAVEVPDDADWRYRYTVTYHRADGSELTLPEDSSDATELFLKPAPTAERADEVTVVGMFIDFAATPLVEVLVTALDAHGASLDSETLLLDAATKKGTLSFDLPADVAFDRYRVETTWYLADGTPVSAEPEETTRTNVVVKKHTPADP